MTIDIDALKQDKRPQSSTIVHALIDRLEAAEKGRDELRAKIEAMERLVALLDRITPEQAPPEIVEYAPIAAEGYADGWNACIKTIKEELK